MKGRKTGGRTKGTPNKRTVERQLHRRAQVERLERVHGELVLAVESGKVADNELMREVVAILGEQLGVASAKSPRPIERTATPLDALLETMYVLLDKWKHPVPGQKPEETIKSAQLLVDVAAKAAPYVHPRLEAVAHADVTPEPQAMSMLDMARRLAFILTSGSGELREKQAPAVLPVRPELQAVYTEAGGGPEEDARFREEERTRWSTLSENRRPDNYAERSYPASRVITQRPRS